MLRRGIWLVERVFPSSCEEKNIQGLNLSLRSAQSMAQRLQMGREIANLFGGIINV